MTENAGQWFHSPKGTRWFFDAGAVSLDFAYLGGFDEAAGFGPASGLPGPAASGSGASGSGAPVSGASGPGASGSTWDGLLVPADLDDWLAARFPGLGAGASERELHDARGLRDAIARLAIAAADGHRPSPVGPGGGDIDTLNLFAALPDIPPSLGGGRRQAGAARLRLGQALSSLARDAVALFTESGFDGEPGSRIRRCDAPDCRLVFVDDSRAGSRRWCSMQKCGNRAKVRAHRARAAAAAG